MGYRSDFALIINTHDKADEVWDKLEDYVNDPGREQETRSLLEEMMIHACVDKTDSVIEFRDSGWKLWRWDDLLMELEDMFGEDPEIDIASIRLGEECDDNDIRHGNYTYVYMMRDIDIDRCDVPPAPKTMDDEKTPVIPKVICQCPMTWMGIAHTESCPER